MQHTASVQPPMPRSLQMRNAAAATANGVPTPMPVPQRAVPEPLLVDQLDAAASAKRHQSSIDYAKYKTKLCRNYVMGVPCPFESRCVFAHGDDQIARDQERVPMSTTSAYSAANSMEFPITTTAAPHGMPPAYYGSSSDDESPMCPPTYETFLATAGYMHTEPASPVESDPATPIAPIRFRHDPYTMEGIVFKYY